MKKTNLKLVATVAGLLMGAFAVSAVAQTSTWNAAPTGVTPPDCPDTNAGCIPPLNVGANDQIKLGGLTLSKLGITTENFIFLPSTPPVAGQVLKAVDSTGKITWGDASSATVEFANAFIESDSRRDKGSASGWVSPITGSYPSSNWSSTVISPVKVLYGNPSAFVRLVNTNADTESRWGTGPIGRIGSNADFTSALVGKYDGIGCATGWQKISCSGAGGVISGYRGVQILPHESACITDEFNDIAETNSDNTNTASPISTQITCMKIN
jgi:hypothetical protein